MRGIAVAVALMLHAAATPAATPGTTLTKVVVLRNGVRSDTVSSDETAAYCSRFRPTPAHVTRFFAQAQPVDAQAYYHDLDMSRCHAAGTARDAAGKPVRWTIDLARRGALTAGGTTRYVYCVTCPSPPFDEMDAETAEAARSLTAIFGKR